MALLTLYRSGMANATPAIPFPPPMVGNNNATELSCEYNFKCYIDSNKMDKC